MNGRVEYSSNAVLDRDRGYYNAMTEAGIEPDPLMETFGYFTVDGGEKAMSALLAQKQPPSAVFAMSDEMAFGAIRSLHSHGLVTGKDVSIVGIDGHGGGGALTRVEDGGRGWSRLVD